MARLRAVARLLRAVLSAPDYDRYLRHMAARHPGCRVMSREEFVAARLEARYARPGARCC